MSIDDTSEPTNADGKPKIVSENPEGESGDPSHRLSPDGKMGLNGVLVAFE
jgi:hypothetical protein